MKSLRVSDTGCRVLWTIGLALVFGLCSNSVSSQVQKSDTRALFVTQEEIELATLLDACAAVLDVPVEYDRNVVAGKVTVRSGPGQSREGLWAMTNRILASKELACIQGAGEDSLGVVKIDDAARLARVEQSADTARAGFIKVLLPLPGKENAGSVEAVRTILSSPGSLVQAIPESGHVLLAGLKPQVLEAVRLLGQLRDPPTPVSVHVVPVRNLPPTALVSLVERVGLAMEKAGESPPRGALLAHPHTSDVIVVAPRDELVRWAETIEAFDRAPVPVTVHYRPRRFGLAETARLLEEVLSDDVGSAGGARIVKDGLTETLIVTAPSHVQEEVRSHLDRLDQAAEDPRRSLRAFSIRYRDVDELLGLLQELVAGRTLTGVEGVAGEGGGSTNEHATGGPVAPRDRQLDVWLSKDEGTNRILAVGSVRTLDELGRLIESLDAQHPQVLVETLIVSLSESQTRDLAIELQKVGRSGRYLGSLATLFGAGTDGPPGPVLPGPSGTGIEGVVLDPGSFSGLIRALETLNEGRTLTIPKLLVNNNQTANLNSVLQTPFTSTNASQTVATTSFGGTQDAGTTIRVTPQITDGDRLLLEYSVSLSSFVGDSSDPSLPPPRQENLLSSVATVPDGYTVVVGGLEIEADTRGESRVPLLGALPWIGNLFKSRSDTSSRSRFFVFLRCSALRTARFEDLRHVSAAERSAAGVADDRPEVRPRVIR